MLHVTPGMRAFVVAAVLLLAPAHQVQAEQAESSSSSGYSIEQFMQAPAFDDMRISPGGTYIATLVPIEYSRMVLAVFERKTMRRTATLALSRGESVYRFDWVSDRRLVVSPARQEGMLDVPVPTGELIAVDANGKRTVPLFGYRLAREGSQATNIRGPVAEQASAHVLDPLPGQEHQILIKVVPWDAAEGQLNEVRRMNLRSGRSSPVARAPVRNADFLTDLDGNVRFSWGSSLAGHQELYARPASGGEWRRINDSSESGVGIVPIGFERGNRRAYVIVEKASGPSTLELLDLETGERRNVTGDPVADIGQGLFNAEGELYAVIVEPDRPRLLYVDPSGPDADLSRALEQAFEGQFAHFTSFTRDEEYGLVHVRSDRNPGQFYMFEMEPMRASYLAASHEGLDPERMSPMRPIVVSTDDGVDLRGYLTLPNGVVDNKPPLVVLPHGGPHSVRDHWQFYPEVQLFASRGYAVLQINFRGSDGYGQAFRNAGFRQWGGLMQDDLAAAVRWAVAEGLADPERICIYGHSYGGYAAMMNPARFPDLYRCAVGYVGVYDLRLMYTDGEIRQVLYGRAFLDRALGNEFLQKSSPVAHADRIKVPVMLVHGGEDQRVPISHAERMRAALRAAGNEPEWLVERREGHGFFNKESRIKLYEQLLAFFDRHIGADANASKEATESP